MHPLHEAALTGNLGEVKKLIKSGINVRTKEDNWTALQHASFQGHTELVRFLLSVLETGKKIGRAGKIDVYTPTFDRSRALRIAALVGQASIVDMLIGAGALVTQIEDFTTHDRYIPSSILPLTSDSMTALHLAAINGDPVVIRRLIAAGASASLDAQAQGLRTPLHIAAAHGHKLAASLLMSDNALRARDKKGSTPLHLATENDHKEVIKLLKAGGADPTAADNSGWSPLMHAAFFAKKELVRLLLADDREERNRITVAMAEAETERAPPGSSSKTSPAIYTESTPRPATAASLPEPRTPAHYHPRTAALAMAAAIENGHIATLKLLLLTGADIGASFDKTYCLVGSIGTTESFTAVQVAAEFGNMEALTLLTERGADLTARTARGKLTLLHLAAAGGHSAMVKHLVEVGADVNDAVQGAKLTPLHVSVASGDVESAKVLVQAGADLAAVDKLSRTPLHVAASKGHEEMLSYLVEAGANLKAVTKPSEGRQTALHVAVQQKHIGAVTRLMQLGADLEAQNVKCFTALQQAVVLGDKDVVRALIEGGADAQVRKPWPVLHLAVERGDQQMAALLHELGIDPNLTGGKRGAYYLQQTALHIAQTPEMCITLLDGGANIDARDRDGMAPLHLVRKSSVCSFLLQAGADPCPVDRQGRSPLHTLIENWRYVNTDELYNIFSVLLAAGNAVTGPYAADKEGNDVMHYVVGKVRNITTAMEMVGVLLEKGASASSKNVKGETPMDVFFERLKDSRNPWDRTSGSIWYGLGNPEYIIALLLLGHNKYGWEQVPRSLSQLERFWTFVWSHSPHDIGEISCRICPQPPSLGALRRRGDPDVKNLINAAVQAVHSAMPNHPQEVKVRIIEMVFFDKPISLPD